MLNPQTFAWETLYSKFLFLSRVLGFCDMQGDFQHHWTPLDNSGIFQMGGHHCSTWPFGECPRVKINEWKTKPCLWAWSGQWVIGGRGLGAETCMRKWVSPKHSFRALHCKQKCICSQWLLSFHVQWMGKISLWFNFTMFTLSCIIASLQTPYNVRTLPWNP